VNNESLQQKLRHAKGRALIANEERGIKVTILMRLVPGRRSKVFSECRVPFRFLPFVFSFSPSFPLLLFSSPHPLISQRGMWRCGKIERKFNPPKGRERKKKKEGEKKEREKEKGKQEP